MAWDKGFNFRATSGYVSDGTNETYSLGEAYPTTRNSVTFGFSGGDRSANSRDRVNTNDRRIAGIVFASNSDQFDFRVDLPASGDYDIFLAIGDGGGDQDQYAWIYDNTSLLFNVANGTDTTTQHFLDANGTDFTNSTWPAGNVAKRLTFSSTILNIRIGGNGAAGASTTLAHLFVSQVTAAATDVLWAQSII